MSVRDPIGNKYKTAAEIGNKQNQAKLEEEKHKTYRNVIDEIGDHSALHRSGPRAVDRLPTQITRSESTHADGRDGLESRQSSANSIQPSTTLKLAPSRSPRTKTDTAEIAKLEAEIEQQKEVVQSLETALEEERLNVARLQYRQEEHKEAEIQAILKHDLEAKGKSQSQVDALTALLKQAGETIKDLQSQIAEGQRKELDLSRQLHESHRANLALHASLANKDCHDSATKQQSHSPCPVELSSNVEVGPRERRTSWQSNNSGRTAVGYESRERTAESRASSSKGSKQRGDQRRLTREAHISMPRGQGRRGVIALPMLMRS